MRINKAMMGLFCINSGLQEKFQLQALPNEEKRAFECSNPDPFAIV